MCWGGVGGRVLQELPEGCCAPLVYPESLQYLQSPAMPRTGAGGQSPEVCRDSEGEARRPE